ncbi:serine/threonine protein kinase [bacterium SCGC AG-212-C10]|nr:serine/threonine protein kinase [bacterium SCGC AG-212-C10]
MDNETILPIKGEADIVAARSLARKVAVEIGFGAMDQSRIATAVSELARNVVRYATNGEGEVRVARVERDGQAGIEIIVEDRGPGIPDIPRAMEQGFTSGKGLGLGLGGTKRLMDEMELTSTVGVGTKVAVRKWRH